MIENGLFVLGGPETQLHDILWVVHDGKNHGSSEGEERGGGEEGKGGAPPSSPCPIRTRGEGRTTLALAASPLLHYGPLTPGGFR